MKIDSKAYYKIENIINNDDRHKLIDLYNSMPSSLARQDYNLNLVDKRQLTHELINSVRSPFEKIQRFAGKELYSHYFVMYKPGSYTRIHTDNAKDVGLTIVTLIDAVDLVGGDTILMLPYVDREKKGEGYVKGQVPEGKHVIPKIVKSNVGESMVYDRNLSHGVTYVEQGLRLVLVSWFQLK